MPSNPRPLDDANTLQPLIEQLQKEKVKPEVMFVKAYKVLDNLLDQGSIDQDESRFSALASRVIGVVQATYRQMPEVFKAKLAFPPVDYTKGNNYRTSRAKDAPSLVGDNQYDYKRAPRPADDA